MVIQLGSAGYEVYVLQRNLNLLGYPVPITGHFDANTETLVKAFQGANNIGVDGIVGEKETWPLMDNLIPHGVDIYDGSDPIDYDSWSKRDQFAIVKCSQGANVKDRTFTAHVTALKALGVMVAAYHWVTLDSAASQVANILDCGFDFGSPGTFGLFLDLEEQVAKTSATYEADNAWIAAHPAAYVQLVLDILQGIETATGVRPGIYTYKNYVIETLGNTAAFGPYPLWISAAPQIQKPGIPAGFATYQFWQWNVTITPPAIGRDCDVDLFNGTKAELMALCNPPA
jgi:lysozyme